MKRIVMSALFSLGATLLFAQQAITDAEVINASDALLKSQNNPKEWQNFQAIVRTETYSPDIRSRVMLLFAVNHLLHMNTNLFASALQTLRTSYPKEGPALAERLTPADWLIPCPECGGTGVKKDAYPTEQKNGSARCLNCAGSGKIVRLGPRVKEQVVLVLGEIKALADENIRFAESSKKALAESDPQRRITALQGLVSTYAHRRDLEEAKQALAKTEAEVAKTEAIARQKKAEQELREQEDKDYQTIHSSLETLPDSGISVMTREIDRFVEKYPKSANRLELEICKTKLQERQKIHTYLWTGFYVCAGLAALSFLLSLIRELFARKKKGTGPLPVPGLTRANEETDPLAGTFSDNDQP